MLIAAMLVLASAPAAAQDLCALLPVAPAAAGDSLPDVVIRATATAREVRFSTQPRTAVRTLGCADSLIVTERVNLPDPVQPGVTYRDVRVGVEIRADFRITCLLPALAADPALAELCAQKPLSSPQPSSSSTQQTGSAPVPDPTGAPPAAPPRR
jgi:hypothetical protein